MERWISCCITFFIRLKLHGNLVIIAEILVSFPEETRKLWNNTENFSSINSHLQIIQVTYPTELLQLSFPVNASQLKTKALLLSLSRIVLISLIRQFSIRSSNHHFIHVQFNDAFPFHHFSLVESFLPFLFPFPDFESCFLLTANFPAC